MKELSIEEKAKAYDEAIEALRSLFAEQAIKHCDRVNIKDITNIFSELKDGDDERIRKNIIATIHLYYGEPLDDEAKEMIAWLEKQADTQKKIDHAYARGLVDAQKALEKQGEQKPIMIQWQGNNLKEVIDFTGKDKNFEKWFKSFEEYEKYVGNHNDIFKLFNEDGSHYEVPVGAWIVKTPDGYNVASKAVLKQKPAGYNKEIPTNLKDIVDKEANAIWEEESTDGCHLVIDSFNMFFGICMQIAEAVVDYKKPAAWSEEDEDNFKHLMDEIVCLGNSRNSANRLHYDRLIKFLDELKNRIQPREEWCDKDERMLDRLIAYFEKQVAFTDDDNPRYANWLKSLRPQSTWKPSEEQMLAINTAINVLGKGTLNGKQLIELQEQLKKLTE